MKRHSLQFTALVVAVLASAMQTTSGRAADTGAKSVSGSADATLQREGKALFLVTRSRTFEIAQFGVKTEIRTVLVEGEVAHRVQVTDDLAANRTETGSVKLSVRPILADGSFGAPTATRDIRGDTIKLESPAGINIVTHGCCMEDGAEELLSLASLETLYVRSSSAPITTYTILGKPARGRRIAVYRPLTAADRAVLGNDPTAAAMITLEGEDEVLQRIMVHLRGAKPRETALDWGSELGWKADNDKLETHTVIDPTKPSRPWFRWKMDDRHLLICR